MNLPAVDTAYLLDFLTDLLNTPSPTGFTQRAMTRIAASLAACPELSLTTTRKGALVAHWPVATAATPVALTAHTDTLGAMVKEIKPSGRLLLTRLGGFAWNTVEGEGVWVFPQHGQPVRGALLYTKASVHVHGGAAVNEGPREDANMEVRLDAYTTSAAETRRLGIAVGDFVAFDPRVEITNGFVRARHLDDKACVACIVAALHALHAAGLAPTRPLYLLFSNYEEVGHGAAAGLPPEISELIAVDMAAVGEGQASDEFHATLCVKDSGGPYHHELSNHLRQLADAQHIPYCVDIYPFYGSDGEALWRAGGDVAVALIGPGVDASHNYERTHLEALLATTRWILAYLLADAA